MPLPFIWCLQPESHPIPTKAEYVQCSLAQNIPSLLVENSCKQVIALSSTRQLFQAIHNPYANCNIRRLLVIWQSQAESSHCVQCIECFSSTLCLEFLTYPPIFFAWKCFLLSAVRFRFQVWAGQKRPAQTDGLSNKKFQQKLCEGESTQVRRFWLVKFI